MMTTYRRTYVPLAITVLTVGIGVRHGIRVARCRVRSRHKCEVETMGNVIDARTRFGKQCCKCEKIGTTMVFPHVDHRRKKPWPQPYWVCADHA